MPAYLGNSVEVGVSASAYQPPQNPPCTEAGRPVLPLCTSLMELASGRSRSFGPRMAWYKIRAITCRMPENLSTCVTGNLKDRCNERRSSSVRNVPKFIMLRYIWTCLQPSTHTDTTVQCTLWGLAKGGPQVSLGSSAY